MYVEGTQVTTKRAPNAQSWKKKNRQENKVALDYNRKYKITLEYY